MSLHNSRNALARRARAQGGGEDGSSAAPRRPRLLLVALPFLAMLAIAIAMPASALAADGAVSGTVTAGGTPAANIYVYVYDAGGDYIDDTTTASDGTYSMSVPAGVYNVEFYDPTGTYATQYYNDEPTYQAADPITVTAGATTGSINAALTAAGAISGTVTNEQTNAPLTGGDVGVYDQQGYYVASGTIASDGTYTINGLLSGVYKVEFDGGTGYSYAYYGDGGTLEDGTNVTVTAGATTSGISGSVEPDANASTITGTVTNGSGVPISDVEVALYDTNGNYVEDANGDSDANTYAYTASDGTYTLADLPPGTYKVAFYANEMNLGFQFYNGASTLGTATPVAVAAAGTASGINASMTTGGKISGTVTDAATGAPVSDCDVEVVDSTGEYLTGSYTNSNGTYTISGVPTGSYYVEFIPLYDTAPGGKEYALQYWKDADTLVQGTPVAVTAGAATTGISAGLVTAGLEVPATVINTITVTKTIVQTPPTVSGSVKVSKKAKASVKFTVKNGSNAPAMSSFTLKLPGGLSFNTKKLKKALKVTGVKYSEKASKGSLTLTLKSTTATTKVSVSISSKGLKVSKKLAKKAKKGTEGALTAHLSVKNASNVTTKLTF